MSNVYEAHVQLKEVNRKFTALTNNPGIRYTALELGLIKKLKRIEGLLEPASVKEGK